MKHPQQEIERRAYQIWEDRGCPLGSPEEDWFRAEQELGIESETILAKVARELGSAVGTAVALLNDALPD